MQAQFSYVDIIKCIDYPMDSWIQGDERSNLIKELHRVKTDIFMKMVESKELPLRPGVKRLILEAFAAGEQNRPS